MTCDISYWFCVVYTEIWFPVVYISNKHRDLIVCNFKGQILLIQQFVYLVPKGDNQYLDTMFLWFIENIGELYFGVLAIFVQIDLKNCFLFVFVFIYKLQIIFKSLVRLKVIFQYQVKQRACLMYDQRNVELQVQYEGINELLPPSPTLDSFSVIIFFHF